MVIDSTADSDYVFFKQQDSIRKQHIGKPYPDFTAYDLDGKVVSNQQLIGKVTMINFWFKHCSPCLVEFEALNALYQKFKDHPTFQFISFTKDPPDDAKESVQKHQLLYMVCPVKSDECYRLNFDSGFPTNIIVDPTGKIIFYKKGGKIDKTEASEEVRKFEQIISDALRQFP